jgi:hypothetical protein
MGVVRTPAQHRRVYRAVQNQATERRRSRPLRRPLA